MSFKAYLNDGLNMYTLLLQELTFSNLKQQITQAIQSTHVSDSLLVIKSGNGGIIETDKDVIDAFADTVVVFHLKSKESEAINNKEAMICYEVKNPLVLLTGAMKYERRQYLEKAKEDLNLLQTLFETKFGYQVFSTYNPNDSNSEWLTLKDLNTFISIHCANLADKSNNQRYDGLIFVWCGHGRFKLNEEDMLLMSDSNTKDFKAIQNTFVKQMEYFMGKPKIFLKIACYEHENTGSFEDNSGIFSKVWYNHHVDIFTIYANVFNIPSNSVIVNADNNATSAFEKNGGSHFTNVFCQTIQANGMKGLSFIIEQVIGVVVGDHVKGREKWNQDISNIHSNVYFMPSQWKIQNGENHGKAEIKRLGNEEMKKKFGAFGF
ncbi:hypothetical protein RFI_15520 [Reticulomyxa filosa]|uniref:Peptidase C14 caspase domain-containing protein n=1 Tax=Reticulomyxa filosa TaxID=46433 RepID=X6N5W4_RETFI|nr:hypothetical protein RFI_15520 [Reticulomyxa filosa]|eukprot:ETO21685.1 hypothetical protein RFI_15520 [Reticulomyxa filosa]